MLELRTVAARHVNADPLSWEHEKEQHGRSHSREDKDQVAMKLPLAERKLMFKKNGKSRSFPKRTKHLPFENITSLMPRCIKPIPVWYMNGTEAASRT